MRVLGISRESSLVLYLELGSTGKWTVMSIDILIEIRNYELVRDNRRR